MKNPQDVRSKTISFAVTEDMYQWVKHMSKQIGVRPSSFAYDWFEHSFGDQIKDFKNQKST